MQTRIIRIIAALLGIVLLLTVFGFHINHPRSGLSNAIGSASSNLVIDKKQKTYNLNDRVLVSIKGAQPSPWFGQIKGVTLDNYLVQTEKALITIPKENISGKMVVLVPFLGYLYQIVGQ
jgi:hypothetical protein